MGAANSCIKMPKCRGIDIEERSISQLQDYLSNSSFTSRELTQCYLKRIELLNPRLKAVIETNPVALEISDKLDEERKNGNMREDKDTWHSILSEGQYCCKCASLLQ